MKNFAHNSRDTSPMFLVFCSIYVVGLLWLYISLWFYHVHLLVLLPQVWVFHSSQLLFNRFLFVIHFLEHHGFALECLLQFSWFWIKSIIVEPLLFKVCQFPEAKSHCTRECSCLKHADFIVKRDLF